MLKPLLGLDLPPSFVLLCLFIMYFLPPGLANKMYSQSMHSENVRPLVQKVRISGRCADWCGSVGWAFSRKAKVCRFDSLSGHVPGLWVWSPVGVCMRGNQLMFVSHINVSLPIFLPPFPPSLKKKINSL